MLVVFLSLIFQPSQEAIFQLSGANKGKGPTTSGNPHHEIQSDKSFPPAERNELYSSYNSATVVGSRGVQCKD